MMMKRQLSDLVASGQVENNMFKILDEKIEMFFMDYGHIIILACLIALLLTLIVFVYLALNDRIIF